MKAAAFESAAHCGTPVRSDELLKQKNLMLYFFPAIQFDKIDQVGQEAYLFKNYMVRLNLKKNEVIGITDDPTDLQKTFVQRFGIPFHILYDRDRSIAKSYGILTPDGKLERTLVCVKKGGAIRHTFKGREIEDYLKQMVRHTRLPWYRQLFSSSF